MRDDRLSVYLGELELKNPVIPASGTFGFGYEMADYYDLNLLGGIALKGTTQAARYGNELPRIAECREGLLNAIGLQNPGVDTVIKTELPRLHNVYRDIIIANVSGFSIEEYVKTAKAFDASDDVHILEINVSCPNVSHGGMAFGTDPSAVSEVCAAVKEACKKPVYMKLSPNVTSIVDIARAAQAAGADGLTLINTLLGMVIDNRTGKCVVSTRKAGFSGPAIKPVAVRMIYEAYEATGMSIMGVGGVTDAEDVLELMSAGASAVQVGAQNLIDPYACKKIVESLPAVLDKYGINKISDIIGRAHR